MGYSLKHILRTKLNAIEKRWQKFHDEIDKLPVPDEFSGHGRVF